MKEITYPIRSRTLKDIATQETLDNLIAQIENWQQGVGNYGLLNLHSCWGKTSVLDKRYQGQTVSNYQGLAAVFKRLYETTKNPKWWHKTNDVIRNVLYLQQPDGGFRHASSEFEPTFDSHATCPIHQGKAALTLLEYYDWEYADSKIKELIKPAIDRHWEYFNDYFWCLGNAGRRPHPYKAGWCGVTNQDLVAVAMLAYYYKCFGDKSRYDEFGKPTLDLILSDEYYYKDMGLFERGDGENFTERTPYYVIIIHMLETIYSIMHDERIPDVIDNVVCHLFDAAYTGEDGLIHLAWGAKTDEKDKSHVTGWIQTPTVFDSYIDIIKLMDKYLKKHPDEEKQRILDSLTETFCAYFYCDGTIPAALWGKNPIFEIFVRPGRDGLIMLIMDLLGDNVQDPKPAEPLCIHRKYGEYTFKQKDKYWAIEENGKRLYGGYTPCAFGITHGDEAPVFGNFDLLDTPDIVEIIKNQ